MTIPLPPPSAPGPADALAAPPRLAQLFRHERRAGRTHPLQLALSRHRATHAALSPVAGVDLPDLRPGPPEAAPAPPPNPASRIDLAELRQRVGALPALPQAVLQALALLRSETASDLDCAGRIALDAALSARILRLANSAFYGASGRVGTMRDAVLLLGRRTLGSVLTTIAVASQFGACTGPRCHFGPFWRHALATALAAEQLAGPRGLDPELAFSAGLLHDIGHMALALHYPAERQAVLAAVAASDAVPLGVERELLGLDHAEAGAMIAAHWHFPAAVVEAIGLHHAPPAESANVSAGAGLADLVHLADALVHALDLDGLPHEAVPPLALPAWQRLAPETAELLAVLERVETGLDSLCRALVL